MFAFMQFAVGSAEDMRVFLLVLLLIAVALIVTGCVIAVLTLYRANKNRTAGD